MIFLNSSNVGGRPPAWRFSKENGQGLMPCCACSFQFIFPHRQQRAALGGDQHVNIAGEFHLVVAEIVIDLLPRDQVAQGCDVTHTCAERE